MKRLEREISLPIAEVTVLEDRAQVTRRGALQLPGGHHRLRIGGFSPVVCDRTLVAQAQEGLRVVDQRVRRGHPLAAAARDETTLALEAERNALGHEQTKQIQLRRRLSCRLNDLKTIATQRIDDVCVDVSHDRQPADDVGAAMDRLLEEQRDLAAELAVLEVELHRSASTVAHLDRRLALRRERPDELMVGSVEIDVIADADGEFELRLDYVVANACWRPYHRVTVEHDQLHFETEGCIWQNTGEAWKDVTVSLSTERRSLGVEPPRLDTDELRTRRRPTTLHVETREQRVERVDVEGAPTTEGLAGVDDGGQPQVRRVEGPASIPSDGRPHRVLLGGFTAPSSLERVAYPELATAVHRVAKLENRGAEAVLAGPVDVVMAGGLSGRTQLGYVGPGEAFELGLGPDAELRVSRESTQKRDDQFRLSSWVRTHHEVRVRLSNLGDGTPKIRVRERVPISELEKVKVTVDERGTTDGARPDPDGFVDWDRVLSLRGTASLVLRYTVERHHDVVMS